MFCKEGGLSASGWTCVGSESLNGIVDSITADEVEEVYLTHDNNSIKLESANPNMGVTSVSIEGYLAAVQESNKSLLHDSAMRLLVSYEAMDISDKKCELGICLASCVHALVESANQNFQRDYIILWQSYVFYMKMVPSVNDSFFIRYSQKAYNLADAHEDEMRTMFVLKLFLDRLTATFGMFTAKQIISSELKRALDPRFFECVICFWDHHNLAPPPYDEAVRRNQLLHQSPPPPYSALQ